MAVVGVRAGLSAGWDLDMIKWFIPILLLLILTGCETVPSTQTRGGKITVRHGTETVLVQQPSNPEDGAEISLLFPDGTLLSAGTGGSRKDEFAGLGLKLDQYKIFSYVGAGVCVLGVALLVASFWFPLIPKLAGPLVFVGGAATAYLSTAIPEYGPYALVLSLVGAVIWYYHHTAGKKDPATLTRKKKNNALPA